MTRTSKRAARGASKPKRKYTRRTAPTAPPAPIVLAAIAAATEPQDDPEFLGMTRADCCADCNVGRCVITGAAICGHPAKGGLQAAFQRNQEIVARYNRARKALMLDVAAKAADAMPK